MRGSVRGDAVPLYRVNDEVRYSDELGGDFQLNPGVVVAVVKDRHEGYGYGVSWPELPWHPGMPLTFSSDIRPFHLS